VLSYQLQKRGDTPLRFDIQQPTDTFGEFIEGSILDRNALSKNLEKYSFQL
jgi:hypothetical protein